MSGALPNITMNDVFGVVNVLLNWAPLAGYIMVSFAALSTGVVVAVLGRTFFRG